MKDPLLIAAFGLLAASAQAGITGTVLNATTGKPEPRVALTLIRFQGGMDMAEEVYSDQDGSFRFDKDPVDSSGQRIAAMIRAEHGGVTYSKMIPPVASTAGVEVLIYDVSDEPFAPTGRVLVIEPGGKEMIVNESYLFNNDAKPPRTFRDDRKGTLRFYLPPAAKGIVQVTSTGPAGMPLRNTAEKTGQADLYYVDFPIKPGENRIDLTYLVAYEGETLFKSRSLYRDLETRIAVPDGVEVIGEGLEAMGTEPATQATIYQVPPGPEFSIGISGIGRLKRIGGGGAGAGDSAAAPSGSGGGEISVEAAPIAEELPWVLALSCAILAVGFYNLLGAKVKPRRVAKETAAAPGRSGKQRGKERSARRGK